MKKSLTIFIQVVIVLIGLAALAALLVEPHFEGVNANATTLADIYLDDPFLAYVYLSSIPFFIALYQAFKLARYAGQHKIFSRAGLKALRTIKYCAFIVAGAIVAADAYIYLFIGLPAKDDSAGAIMLGIIATVISLTVAVTATVFQGILQKAVDMKSENQLTV